MKIIGALCDERRRDYTTMQSYIKSTADQGGTHLYMIDDNPDEWVQGVADECQAHGLQLILGLTANPAVDKDEWKLRAGIRITKDIAMGTRRGEWSGTRNTAIQHICYEESFGFRWHCPMIVGSLIDDFGKRNGAILDRIGQRPVMCLCAYVVSGYLFRDLNVPHQGFRSDKLQKDGHRKKYSQLSDRNLNDIFGVTITKWKQYIEPRNVWTGAGGQEGLEAGTMAYAEALGFKGIVISLPFDLSKAKRFKPDMTEPVGYPERCGFDYDIRPAIEQIKGLA